MIPYDNIAATDQERGDIAALARQMGMDLGSSRPAGETVTTWPSVGTAIAIWRTSGRFGYGPVMTHVTGLPPPAFHCTCATFTPSGNSNVTQPTSVEPGVRLKSPLLKLVPAASPLNTGGYSWLSGPWIAASLFGIVLGAARDPGQLELGADQVLAAVRRVGAVARLGGAGSRTLTRAAA